MSAKDIKTFKLKARGDAGSCKTELLIAFGRIAQSFGMETAMSMDGHDMNIRSTKEQRCALYEFNRRPADVLFQADNADYGVIRVALWPEGLNLWVGGEMRWKSWS